MKKLIPAICLMLVTAMLVGTSTYAWFTMNTSVSASGMQVKASAGTGLVISLWDNDAKSSTDSSKKGWTVPAGSVTASDWNKSRACDTIEPTSTINAIDWFTAVAAKENEADAKGSKYTLSTSFSNKYDSSLYYYDKFEVKTNDGNDISDKSLVVTSIGVSDGSDSSHTALSGDLNKALRVALVVTIGTTSKTYFYAPSYPSYPDVNGVKVVGSTGYEAVKMSTLKDVEFAADDDQITLSQYSISGSTTVEMYVFYDGEDSNCYTNNTLGGLDTLSVSINFKAVDEAKPATPSVSIVQSGTTLTATPANAGSSPTYEWQYYDDSDDPASWEAMGTGVSSGSGTTTLVLTDGVTYDGEKVRCVMTVGSTKYPSNEITLSFE